MADSTVEAKLTDAMERLVALQERNAQLQQQQVANQKPRKVDYGEYYEKWSAGRPVLTRDCYHTGHILDADSLEPEDIKLLNRISRSGLYVDKMVTVTLNEEGGGRQSVHILYNNAKSDQRNDMLRKVQSFTQLLEKVVAAQDAENAEEQSEREVKKAIREGGTFGNNKAYREAKAVADARATNG